MRNIHSLILSAGLLGASLPVQAQTCRPNIKETTPASRFTVNANGTVLDKRTGLIWKRCAEGFSGTQCATGTAAHVNWGSALTLAMNSSFAGYKDWRLPSSKELESLVEIKCWLPSINLAVFPNTEEEAWFWSSSTYADTTIRASAWVVEFGSGSSLYNSDRNSDYNRAVRLVRGGQ